MVSDGITVGRITLTTGCSLLEPGRHHTCKILQQVQIRLNIRDASKQPDDLSRNARHTEKKRNLAMTQGSGSGGKECPYLLVDEPSPIDRPDPAHNKKREQELQNADDHCGVAFALDAGHESANTWQEDVDHEHARAPVRL